MALTMTFSLTQFVTLGLAVFVSLLSVYIVMATEGRERERVLERLVTSAHRVRVWFTAFALAFFALFLKEFMATLPATAMTERVAGAAGFAFYAIMTYVVVNAYFIVARSRRAERAAEATTAAMVMPGRR